MWISARLEILVAQLLQISQTSAETQIGALSIVEKSQRAVLPDPTSDLHWEQFRGPISTIFSQNAESHPDRACVVVSTPEGSDLTYTYDTIHRKSNALAKDRKSVV